MIIFSRMIKCFFLASLLLFAFAPCSAHAQEKIVDIEVQGNTSVDSSVILSKIYTQKGDTYDRAKVSEDVVRVFNLGTFDDVQVEKVPVAGGIKLVFIIKDRGLISQIQIEGNKKVKEKKIREVITIKPNSPADPNKIAESKEKIKELYTKEGYDSASVTTEFRDRGGQTLLVFVIQENFGTVVKEINFEGNTVFSERQLRKMIKTKKKNFLSFLTGGGKFNEDVVERDVAMVTYSYLNKGYMRVRVGGPRSEYSEKEKGLILTFNIDEGKQYRVGDMSFAGDILTTQEQLFKFLHTMKGNIYSQKILEEDLTKIQEFYGNQGYAFANINPVTNLNDTLQTADINFQIDKGQKVFIERINITGNTITRDKVIRRELKVVENSLYNEELVKLSKRKLEQLGFFETVEFSTPKGSAENALVLNIAVKEKPTGTFSVGAGFSSSESFLLTASVAKNNFMGLGISGSINAELSGKRQQFSFQYTDPYFANTNWIFNAAGYRIATDFEDFRRKSFGGEINFGRRIFDFTSVSLGYHIEDVKIDDFNVIVPEFFRLNVDGLTSSLVLQVQRDTRNNPMVTTKGTYASFMMEYAGNGIGGDVDFLRLTGNLRGYLPMWKGSVLKGNLRLGYIKSLNDEAVPLYERYFTGGINSLRGFEFRSVGPRVTIPASITGPDEEFVYGGDKLLLFNLEYEFPIYDPAGFRGVVFFDAGNAYAENQNLNPFNVRADVGAGVRWISPFGPLRFEWGFPIVRREGEKRSVFNFTIGSFF